MLKHFDYSGSYHDEEITIGITLENPLTHGLAADTLVFSVTVDQKKERAYGLWENSPSFLWTNQGLFTAHGAPYRLESHRAS